MTVLSLIIEWIILRLLPFHWMNKYVGILLCVRSLSAFELLISDARWCDSCHRSVGDDRIRAEVITPRCASRWRCWHRPRFKLLCRVAPLWGLWPSSGCRTAVSVAQWVEAARATFGFHKATVFLHTCFKQWTVCEKWSLADPKIGFIQDLFLSHLIRSKQVQSYQAFYVFSVCFSKLISFKESSWCLDSARHYRAGQR